MIKEFFSPPHFDDEDQNTKARFLNGISWIVIGLVLAIIPLIIAAGYQDFTVSVLLGIIVAFGIAIFLLKRKYLNSAAIIVITLASLVMGFQAYTADGVRDVIIIAYLAVAMLASLTINVEAAVAVLVFGIAVIWSLAFLQENGTIIPTLDTPLNYARDLSAMFVIVASLIYYVTLTLRRALKRYQISTSELQVTNQELQSLRISLEQRIEERTAELTASNQFNERRAKQFEAVAQVARTTTTDQNIENLLASLVTLISQQFGFYHAGIFLVDENREFAILRSANSDGGKRMLDRGHQLKIGQSGIVGFVTATAKPRIALDVGSDAAFFDNPDLPKTRSELALPLRIADQVIGVLDVQSTESNAFQEQDIEVLSTLADQVAIAIQTSRSYETNQKLLKEAQQTSGAFLRESWKVLHGQDENIGYQFYENKLKRLSKPVTSAQINEAIARKETVQESGKVAILAVPIRLRNEVIGVMNIRVPDEHDWEADEIDIAEAVAERLSLVLESSLLLKSTQRQAEIERITADISTKIGATTQFETILRTAAEELSRVLGGSEVLVQLHSNTLEEQTD
ncbi:MAG: GAF domain-containing protein [Chloroflexota bacterium]